MERCRVLRVTMVPTRGERGPSPLHATQRRGAARGGCGADHMRAGSGVLLGCWGADEVALCPHKLL